MDAILAAGLVCLVAAVIGGGLSALGFNFPMLKSLARQIALGILGVILIVVWFVMIPGSPPKIVSFSSTRPKIILGEKVTLNWDVIGADTVTLEGKAVKPSDSMNVSPNGTTNYVLVAKNKYDSIRQEFTVVVEEPAPPLLPPPKIVSFFPTRSKIMRGEKLLLNWNVIGADTVTIEGEVVGNHGSKEISPGVTTTYVLIAQNKQGSVPARCTVTVEEPAPPPVPPPQIVSFYPTKEKILPGERASLNWEVTGADTVTIAGEAVGPRGSKEVSPNVTTTYLMIAKNNRGTDFGQCTVRVEAPAPPPKPTKLIGYLVVSNTSNISRLQDLRSGDKLCASESGREFLRSFPPLANHGVAVVSSSELYSAMRQDICKATFFQQRESADRFVGASRGEMHLLLVYD